MPSHKSVMSLQSLSLSTIINHCKTNRYPFTKIPKRMLVEMVNHAEYKKYLSRTQYKMILRQYTNNLGIVIHKFTNRLNFYQKPRCVIQRGIELICKFRPNLTHLNLSNSSIKVKNLRELAKSIPNIQALKLTSTKTTDEVLSIIGQNCPYLRKLDVSNCKITDVGIQALCNDGSQFIRKLKVSRTSITDQGALMVMRTFPHLRYFDYLYILRVIATMYKQDNEIRFQLEYIRYCNLPDTANFSLGIAAVCCPNVTNVCLSSIQETDYWLTDLAKFPKLTDLKVMGVWTGNDVTYPRNIAHLLKTRIGHNLKTLNLYGIKDLDLWDIGRHCRQITRLGLLGVYVSLIPFIVEFPRDIFSELREFTIHGSEEDDAPVDQLECLLSNCREIEKIIICGNRSVTDDMMTRVLRRNSFSKLSYFCIKRCSNIGISTLKFLVKSCKLLQELEYEKCAKIRAIDRQRLQDLVRKENLDLSILFDV